MKSHYTTSPEALATFNNIIKKKTASHNKVLAFFFILFAILALAAFVEKNMVLGGIAFVTLIISLNVSNSITHSYLLKDEYYSIPTSKNNKIEHQCMFCGNRGIYKSTIYQTQITVNKCSKCEKVLFLS